VSRAIKLRELPAIIQEYGLEPFVVMNEADGPPHVMHVGVCVEESPEGLTLTASCGRAAADRLSVSPKVAFLWPANRHNTMNLIVDARLSDSNGSAADIAPDAPIDFLVEGAVFHRPAESAENC
jgi:hypothetical protein